MKWMRNKIEHWRQQPEHARMRIAARLTWGMGAAAIVLWLTVLLPLQLYVTRDKQPQSSVQGTTATHTPEPTASPTPLPTPGF